MATDEALPRFQSYDGSFRFYERLNELLGLDGLSVVKVASAYARWDGLGLISESLEAFLSTGGKAEFVFGFDNGVTSPDSFLYGLYLTDLFGPSVYLGAVKDGFDNATFHPKVFQFWYRDKAIILVGSANLTGAGLSRNIEVGTEITFQSSEANAWNSLWHDIRALSEKVDIEFVRKAKLEGRMSSEASDQTDDKKNSTGLYLDVDAPTAPKPLFSKFLDIKKLRQRTVALRKLDPVSNRPNHLYLQILENETGGQGSGSPGYQIQLPVATLSAFFGVGPAQSQEVVFRFPSEDVRVMLTHFENNTHRVRLRPLRDAARPTVVRFERTGAHEYNCHILPRSQYSAILHTKCTQQTRAGARWWGIE
jgi:hypothetical protein